jgi:DNA-binding YbaB/EbfC family protein
MRNLAQMQQLMNQVQQMQEQFQKQLDDLVVEASAGGGMVSVKMNGQKHLLSIRLEKEAVSSGDVELLQDLVLAAVNEACRKVDEQIAGQMGNLTSGLKLPGILEGA